MHLYFRRSHTTRSCCVSYVTRIIAVFDDVETATVSANRWWGIDVFRSQQLLDLVQQREDIQNLPTIPLEPLRVLENSLAILPPLNSWLAKKVKLAVNSWRIDHAHHITLRDLVRGVELSGSLDEVTMTEDIITKSVQILDAKLNAARSFNGTATIVNLSPPRPAAPPPQPLRRLAS